MQFLAQKLQEADSNRDGTIDYDEFVVHDPVEICRNGMKWHLLLKLYTATGWQQPSMMAWCGLDGLELELRQVFVSMLKHQACSIISSFLPHCIILWDVDDDHPAGCNAQEGQGRLACPRSADRIVGSLVTWHPDMLSLLGWCCDRYACRCYQDATKSWVLGCLAYIAKSLSAPKYSSQCSPGMFSHPAIAHVKFAGLLSVLGIKMAMAWFHRPGFGADPYVIDMT